MSRKHIPFHLPLSTIKYQHFQSFRDTEVVSLKKGLLHITIHHAISTNMYKLDSVYGCNIHVMEPQDKLHLLCTFDSLTCLLILHRKSYF